MTSQSTNLDLTYYDSGDTSETFIDFRTDIAASSASNMSKIDAFAGAISDGSFIIIDTAGTATAYTATGVTLLDGATALPSSVPVGTKILLKPNVANSGVCTLQINGGDINTLKKVYAKTDGISDLQSGDLQTAKYYIFFFNGSAWILLSPVTLNQLVVDDATNGDLEFSTTTNTYAVKAGAVTLPKIANISSGRLLGRSSAGSGVVEELTPADVISVLDLANALIYLGTIDCSTNPNYPEANAGDLYVVSSAGKIGGASGEAVDAGDFIICNTDATPSGDEVTVGQYWDTLQTNIDGAITGTGSSTNGNIPEVVGVDMAVLQDSGYSPADLLDADNHTDGTTNKVYTATEQTKLAGIETGADVTDATNVDAAGAVMETDFDAQTILAATSDDTPVTLAVGEQTVVGRVTGGDIDALSVSQLATLALSASLPENTAVILDSSLSADGKYSGIVEGGTAGATLAFGDLCYLAVADSRWELADADALATSGGVKLGMCVLAAAGDASATTMLLFGKIRADTTFPTLTVGAPAYVGETAGDIVVTAPSGSGDTVRIVGQANTANELHFNPSPDWIELS